MAKLSIKSCFLVVTLFCMSLSSYAAMYKWVDGNGKTHYSSSPPPNQQKSKAIKYRKSHVNSKKALDNVLKKNQAFESRYNKNKESRNKSATALKNKAIKKQNCEDARSNLKGFNDPMNRYYLDDSGKKNELSTKTRAEKIKVARQQMKENCQ